MAAFSRGIRPFLPLKEPLGTKCHFSSTTTTKSGHSRWSKIKHDKMGADAKRSKSNGFLSQEIAFASKVGGPDPNLNYKLATALLTAKKAGFPKANMEAAIARGQGKSASGAALEFITLEAIMPPTIAMIIEAETDNSKRTLGELRYLVKEAEGVVTPTSYLFKKKGRVVLERDERGLGVDEVLDEAIEAGAEDVEADDDGSIIIWTEPSKTTFAAGALQKSLGMKVESSDIIWDAKEDTKVPLDSTTAVKALMDFIDLVRENQNVQGVYANVAKGSLPDEVWEDLEGRLDS